MLCLSWAFTTCLLVSSLPPAGVQLAPAGSGPWRRPTGLCSASLPPEPVLRAGAQFPEHPALLGWQRGPDFGASCRHPRSAKRSGCWAFWDRRGSKQAPGPHAQLLSEAPIGAGPACPGCPPQGKDTNLSLSALQFHPGAIHLFHFGHLMPASLNGAWKATGDQGRDQFIQGILEGSQSSGNPSEPGNFQGGTSRTKLWTEATVSSQRPTSSSEWQHPLCEMVGVHKTRGDPQPPPPLSRPVTMRSV